MKTGIRRGARPRRRDNAPVDELRFAMRAAQHHPRPDWRDDRACKGKSTHDWFAAPDIGAAICAVCPVRMDCTAETLRDEADFPMGYVVGYFGVSAEARKSVLCEQRGIVA